MKKPFIVVSLLILIIVSFVGGARFNQHGTSQKSFDTYERRILHYVDPMNPANTSKEPGIAPCGMPMEPVYADDDTIDGSEASNIALSTILGTVRVNARKQQIVGVQVDEVKRAMETSKIRALGRIVPDENKVYALVAATDGWMGEIHDSTTGSLVRKDQLMGKIKVYDYDFFTWQQRYLTELGNAGRRTVFVSNTSGAEEQMKKVMSAQMKAGSILPDIGAPITLPAKSSTPWSIPPGATQYGGNPQKPSQPDLDTYFEDTSDMLLSENEEMVMPAEPEPINDPALSNGQVPEMVAGPVPDLPIGPVPELPTGPVPELPMGPVPDLPSDLAADLPQSQGSPMEGQMPSMAPMAMPATIDAEEMQPSSDSSSVNSNAIVENDSPHHQEMGSGTSETKPAQPAVDHSQHMKKMNKEMSGGLFFTAEDDVLYASKARQELLDYGVLDSQFAQLAKTGVYVTYVELRSPVDGLVLSRNITTRERISRGEECFRVADLSRVWVETDIYDIEAKYIQPGMAAMVSMPKMGKFFAAKVSDVLPEYDAVGRSLKVRLEMDNPENIFRPDMFVDVDFHLELPETITVPSGAIIDSGRRQTVYVAAGEGIFEPRTVMTGWRFNGLVEIVKGLSPGEKIVVSGNFLIDSESRMKLAAARLMDDTTDTLHEVQAPVMMEPQAMPHPKKDIEGETTVMDPICGMNIDPVKAQESGLIIEAQGTIYYFCSEECAIEFHRHGPQLIETTGSVIESDISSNHMEHDMGAMNMSPRSSQTISEQTVEDPFCGMTVDKQVARSAGLITETGDETHYFCSKACKESFDQSQQHQMDTKEQIDGSRHMDHKP